MGFYFRKSISVGPFRFNFSKSGIGISAGVKGFRFGTGPKGNYVRIGRDGIYYQKIVSGEVTEQQFSHAPVSPRLRNRENARFGQHCGPGVEIKSSDVSDMNSSSSAQLLEELNTKRKRLRLAPLFTFSFGITVIILIAEETVTPAHYLVSLCAAAIAIMAFWLDKQRKTTCLWYELDPAVESSFAALHNAALEIASCSRCWHIEESAKVHDRKYHAGASNLIRRTPTTVRIAVPKFLRTNIKAVEIGVGNRSLFFFPDRLLVFDRSRVGAVDYGDLTLDICPRRFIEDETPPQDASVVGHSWRYVNKNGSPDLRFSGNQKLPICLYDELHFLSPSGLNELIQISRADIANPLESAIRSLASYTAPAASGGQSIYCGSTPSVLQRSFVYVAIGSCALAATFLTIYSSRVTPKTIPPPADTSSARSESQAIRDATATSTPPARDVGDSSQKLKVKQASEPPRSDAQVPKFATVEEAQREAVRRYPELGVRGSKLNAAFLARYRTYRQLKPEYFKDNAWPIRLAEEVLEPLSAK